MKRIILIAALALAACTPPRGEPEAACEAPAREQVVAQMYFGRNIGGTLGVSDEQWAQFVNEDITPRFPNGLTVTDAQGQWNSADGVIHEPSKVLTVFLEEGGEQSGRALLSEIADIYKQRFQQDAVALVIERSCVAFE